MAAERRKGAVRQRPLANININIRKEGLLQPFIRRWSGQWKSTTVVNFDESASCNERPFRRLLCRLLLKLTGGRVSRVQRMRYLRISDFNQRACDQPQHTTKFISSAKDNQQLDTVIWNNYMQFTTKVVRTLLQQSIVVIGPRPLSYFRKDFF